MGQGLGLVRHVRADVLDVAYHDVVPADGVPVILLIVPRPLLQIVGSRAVTSWVAVDAHQRAKGFAELYWIDGASHVDLHRQPDVRGAVSACGG
ncbi:hypothetical protein [Streptomyces sp. AcE210]|uniref:hypothetical protein n=1 Tax=Streptomyces sp. AcE210 TaxID=2292703 RepID=UPI0019CFC9EE